MSFSCRNEDKKKSNALNEENVGSVVDDDMANSEEDSLEAGFSASDEPELTGMAALKIGPFALEEPSQDIFKDFECSESGTQNEFIRDLITADGKLVILVKNENGFYVLTEKYDNVIDPYYGKSPYKISSEFWFGRNGYETRYIPVAIDGKWGYADMHRGGELAVPAVFDEIHPFREGLGAVKKDGYWGFTDGKRMVTQLCFLSVQDFYNGMCVVTYKDSDGKNFIGCIRKDNFLVFAYPHTDIKGEGLNDITNFYEPDITSVNDGSCAVVADGRIVLENLTLGSYMERRTSEFDFSYSKGTLCVRAQLNEELFNQTGSESKSSLYGAFDRTGKWVYEPKYSFAELEKLLEFGSEPKEWLGKKGENGLFGFVDASGKWVIEPQFSKWSRFYDGQYAKVSNADGKVGFIDTDGSYVIEPVYDDIYSSSVVNTYKVKLDGKFGIIDRQGNSILPCEYDYTDFGSEDFPIEMWQGEKFGCVNEHDEWVLMLEKGDKVRSKNGLMLVFHPEFDRPAVKKYAQSFRVYLFLTDGTPLLEDSVFYEEFFEDGP